MTTFPTKQAFQTWLETQPPDTIIAEGWDAWCCPLAKFTTYGISPRADGGIYWVVDHGPNHGKTMYLPEWAKQFAKRADDWGDKNRTMWHGRFPPITAAQCLSILETIPDA